MGASGGVQYIVLSPGSSLERFTFLMSVIPVEHNGSRSYDYSSFTEPGGEYYMGYWADTYRCFYFEDDLQDILDSIEDGFFHDYFLGVTSDCTWGDLLEDWQTSPYQGYWTSSWKMVAEWTQYAHDKSILTMTLRDWAKEMKSMISHMGTQETWT